MAATRTRLQRAKGYDPEPFDVNPLWRWPMQPVAILRWLLGTYLFWQTAAWYAIGYVAWRWLTPGLERFASLGVDDVALLWVRNAAIMLVVIGGQHYFLYMRKTQGTDFKYESRWPATNRKSFTFDDQVKDNMFWCLASGRPWRPSTRRCCSGSMPVVHCPSSTSGGRWR